MADSKVAIVTGARSGIGLATARLLASEGWRLVLNARNEHGLEEVASELPTEWEAVGGDVRHDATASSIVDRAIARFGRLDGVVNNAGMAKLVPLAETTPEVLRDHFEVNTFGTAQLIVRAWPHLSTGSCIVNISSVASVDPFPGFFAYGASKAAVNLLARSAAIEGAERGIRAFGVAPGATETTMLRSLFDEELLPGSATMAPEVVATTIVACLQGEHDDRNGETILVTPDAG